MKTTLEILDLLDAGCDLAIAANLELDPKLIKMNLELLRVQVEQQVIKKAGDIVQQNKLNRGRKMNANRIKEIQKETGYPESITIQQALLKVWNETQQEMKEYKMNDNSKMLYSLKAIIEQEPNKPGLNIVNELIANEPETKQSTYSEDYQKRVVEEKKELDEKIQRLKNFMHPTDTTKLDEVDYGLLMVQLAAMENYTDALSRRIELF